MTVIGSIFYWIMILLAGFFIFAVTVDWIVYRGGTFGYFVWLLLLIAYSVMNIVLLHRHNPVGFLTFAAGFLIYQFGTYVYLYWVMWKNR